MEKPDSIDCDQLKLAIVAGPPNASDDELSSESDLHEVVELAPIAVAEALLAISGISCTATEPPASWDWEATLTAPGTTLRLRMTLVERDGGEPWWGGFSLHGQATVNEVCRVAQALRDKLGSIWIHDGDCIMRTPDAFKDAAEDF